MLSMNFPRPHKIRTSILSCQIPQSWIVGEFLLVWQRVNASDCALKGNLEMQYSTIFADEGTMVSEKERKGESERKKEREKVRLLPRLNIGTPTSSSYLPFSVDLRPFFVLDPSISSTQREEVTWQLLFAFLSYWRKYLIKLVGKRRLEEEYRSHPSQLRLQPPVRIHTFKSYSTSRTVLHESSNISMDGC